MTTWIYTDDGPIEYDDTTRTATDYSTDPPTTRDYTPEENADADHRLTTEARLDDHETRIVALEAAVFPPDPDPTPGEPIDAPTWADLGGVWPNGTLLLDGGRVWRNVSGVPLTTPPTGFPGDPAQWGHLFVPVTEPDPDPDPDPGRPEGYVGPWDAATRYEVGDVCDRGGRYYRCKVAHGAEYQGTWGPPQASVWDDLGPA